MTAIRNTVLLLAATFVFTACSTPRPNPISVPVPEAIPQKQMIDAALSGNLAVIDQSLAAGYKVDARDPEERTVLMYAAFNGQTAVARKLIAAGADVNAREQTGSTALMFAASGPNAETVKLLIESGAKVNAIDSNEHFSALMWAAAEGQAEIVRLLLQNKADTTFKDVDGDTAESFAAQKGHTAIVQILQGNTPSAFYAERELAVKNKAELDLYNRASASLSPEEMGKFLSTYPDSEYATEIQNTKVALEHVISELKKHKLLSAVKVGENIGAVVDRIGQPDQSFERMMLMGESGFKGYVYVGSYHAVKHKGLLGTFKVTYDDTRVITKIEQRVEKQK